MEKTIRWGILGTSYISEVMAQAIQASRYSKLSAVASRSLSKANIFAKKFSVEKVYRDYQTLIEDDDIDAIYIGLPNHLHKTWIINCARANKHMLCEKPWVLTVAEAKEVISVLEKTNVFCMEALMYRCHPFTKKIQEVIASKIIGKTKFYNAFYSANICNVANPIAGGSIRNLGCYPVSLVRLLARQEPTQIISSGRLDKQNHTDNQASLILKFQDETLATISTADDIEMDWQFTVYGTLGRLEIMSNPWLPGEENKMRIALYNQSEGIEIITHADKPLYTYQIDVVCNSIYAGLKQTSEGPSWDDSLGNVQVLDRWLQQIKLGNSVLPTKVANQ